MAARKREDAKRANDEVYFDSLMRTRIQFFIIQARIKQREEENMDRKADKAQGHGEQLRKDRETILERIQGYHRHIDGCTAEMSK